MKQTHKSVRALSVLMAIVLLVQTMGAGMSAFAAYNEVTGNVIGEKNYTIYNPYEPVNWDTWYQYRGMTHVHTHVSDGSEDINEMVEKYYELGYQVMCITDHGTVNYGWTKSPSRHTIFSYQSFVHGSPAGISSSRKAEIDAGVGRADGIGMMEVPLGNEQNGASTAKCHVCTYFADAGDGDMGMDEDWPRNAIQRVVDASAYQATSSQNGRGVAHINHVGEWSGGNDDVGTYDASFVSDMASLYTTYSTNYYNTYRNTNNSVLAGMELVNTSDGRTKNDRVLYDRLLQVLAPQGINVYGFCEDDAHEFSDCARNTNFYIMPSQTVENLRTTMRTGMFFASSKYSKTSMELGSGFTGAGWTKNNAGEVTSDFPRIQRITVDQNTDQITFETTYSDRIRMVSNGQIIENKKLDVDGETVTLDLNAYESQIGSYVRVYLSGPGGITYVQPFLLTSVTEHTATVAFNLPSSDTSIVVKNSSNVVQQEINSNHTFVLTPGTYTYVASRFAFQDATGSFTVTQADYDNGTHKEYTVTLEPDETITRTRFYVPETIYLDPVDGKTFLYYADRANDDAGALNTSANKTTGNIYFHSDDAENVTITASVVQGGDLSSLTYGNSNASLPIVSNNGTVSTAITSGALTSKCSGEYAVLEWTATYTVAHATLTAKAYSVLFKSLSSTGSVAAAGGYAKTKKNITTWAHTNMHVTGSVWLAGAHTVSGGEVAYKFPYYGGGTNVAVSGDDNLRIDGVGMSTESEDSSGGSVDLSVTGGSGYLTIDTSRITNYNQVPLLAVGLDFNNATECEDGVSGYLTFGGTTFFNQSASESTFSGKRIYTADNATSTKINRAVNTSEEYISVVGQVYGSKESRHDCVIGTVKLFVTYTDKTALRNLIAAEVIKCRQSGLYMSESNYEAYLLQLKNAYIVLGNPKATTASINSAYSGLQAAADDSMLVEKTSTATVNHRFLDGTIQRTENVNYELGSKEVFAAVALPGCEYADSWDACRVNGSIYATGDENAVVLYMFDEDMTVDFYYDPYEYTVTFDTLGAETPSSEITVNYGQQVTIPTQTPIKTGYTFNNWFFDQEPSATYQCGALVNYVYESDGVFTANYTPKSYTVSFNLDGGDASALPSDYFDPIQIDYDESFMLPGYTQNDDDELIFIEKSGYRFTGWKLSTNNTIYPAGFTMTWQIDSSAMFTANWTAMTYTVAFSAGEGGSGSIAPMVVFYSDYFALPDYGEFTRTGYEQIGWRWNGTTYFAEDTLTQLTDEEDGVVTFEAIWAKGAYTVIFDTQKTGLTLPNGRAVYGETYAALPTPSYPGYVFDGWYTQANGGTQMLTSTPVTVQQTHTLYAHWHEATYTVTLTGEAIPANTTIQATYGSTYSNLTTPTRAGYTFTGWYLGSNLITSASTVTATQNHTLTATWQATTYTVSFETGTSATVSPITVTYDSAYGELQTLEWTDHWFRGWKIKNTNTMVTADTIVATASNHVLQAVWETKQYITVYFDSTSGDSKTVAVTGTYGELPDRSEEGYTFDGWFYNNALITADTVVTATANHTLTSQFTPNSYTVSFDTQATGVSAKPIHVTFDQPYGTLPNPTRSGYTFGGWKLNGNTVTSATIVKTGSDHSLTAVWNANSYVITLQAGMGNADTTTTVTYGQPYTGLTTPTCTGYTFAGWYYLTTPITPTTNVLLAANHTLTADWDFAKYTVSFNAGLGSACNPIEVTYQSNYGALPTSTRAGYTLAYWKDGDTPIYANTTVTRTADHTLDAQWNANSYTVIFDSNGGSVCENMTVTYDQTYANLPTPTMPGQSFLYWTLNGTPVSNDTLVRTASVHTLVAAWGSLPTYTVSFDCAGGSRTGNNDNVPDKTVTYTMTYGELETPIRTGYTFGGWYLDDQRILASSTVSTASNHTLVAHWNPLSYTVTLDPQNGDARTTFTLNSNQKYGANLTTPTRTGYSFAGWAYNGTTVTAASDIAVLSNHTLTASWTPNKVTVTLNGNGGTFAVSSIQVDYDGYYTGLPTAPLTAPANSTFGGWYNGDTLVSSSAQVTLNTAHTLTAHWITGTTYTISFNSNGGSACDPVTVVADEAYLAKLPTPIKQGYAFSYWYYENVNYPISGHPNYDFGASITLTAYYTAAQYRLTLDLNYDGIAPTTATVTYGSSYGSKLSTPTRDGYNFAGWYYGDTLYTSADTVNITSNHTMVARWTPATFTVTFETNGGTSCQTKTVTYGEVYGALPTTTKSDNHFIKWVIQNTDTEITEDTIVTQISNHTLEAVWQSVTYCTVSFNTDGGSEVASQQAAIGDPYGTLPEPTKNGYRFAGWTLGTTPIYASTIVTTTTNHTLTANWTPRLYSISFNTNGSTDTFDPITVLFGEVYGELPVPTRTNYYFLGWKYDGSYVTEDSAMLIAQNHQLVADWAEVTYTVTWVIGENTTVDTYTIGETIVEPTIPAKTGYTSGWNATVPAAMGMENLKFTAVYTAISYTIHYLNAEGATYQTAAPQVHTYDTATSIPNPSKAGYMFNGWILGDNAPVQSLVLGATDHTADIYLTADWTANTYSINLSSTLGGYLKIYENGVQVPFNNGTFLAPFGTELVVKPISVCGYELSSLYLTGSNGTRTSMNGDFILTVGDNVRITAVYTATKREVSVEVEGGLVNGRAGDMIPLYGLVTVNANVPSGKVFSHWAEDTAEGAVVSYSAIYTFTAVSNIHLVAVYSDSAVVDKTPSIVTCEANTTVHRTVVNGNNSLAYYGMIALPADCQIVKVGLLLTNADTANITDENFRIGGTGIALADLEATTINWSNGSASSGNGIVKVNINNVASGQTRTGRYYVTYIQNGVTQTIYSDSYATLTA